MPRCYVRKTQKLSWTEDQLKAALHAIRDGVKIREAGRQYGIPESTLRDKLKIEGNTAFKRKLGRNPIFSPVIEEQLTNHVKILANMFYGLTPIELRRLAFAYATKNNIKHNFSVEKGVAGKDWLFCFLKRNPELSLREPDNTSINRIAAFNEEEVKRFFSNLETVFAKHPYSANQIYNQDETGISNVQKISAKVYAKKGQKRVGSATSAERGKTITVVCAFNAAGTYVPPMIIYPRKRMAAHLQRDGPIGTVYECSHNGWSNEKLFIAWLHHFCRHAKPTEDDPVLLICDNHTSHISIEAYDFCKTNYITVVSIPPHTSHRLQPLDLTFFGPLKGALSREYGLFMTQNAHRKITTADIAMLLNRAYVKVATIDKAVSGFRSAGICPLNPDKFCAEDFAPAEEFRELTVSVDIDQESSFDKSAEPIELTSEHISSEAEPQPCCSKTLRFSDIAPVQKFINKNKSNGSQNRKQHSEILTSTPMKQLLQSKKKEKDDKERKKMERLKGETEKTKTSKKKLLKRKLFENGGRKTTILSKKSKVKSLKKTCKDSDNSDSDLSESEICDDNEVDDIEISISDQNNENCIYCDDTGRQNEEWYRCVTCGFWAHAECSGWDSPEDYTCDICVKRQKKKSG